MEIISLRLKIYRLAVDGISQREIASLLVISRQDVHYHIKHLLKKGYLRCKNIDELVKIYEPTDKTYNAPTGDCKKHGRGGRSAPCHGNVCRVHCIGYVCDIVRSPVVNIRWEHTFSNNGTTYSDKHWDTDLGRVTFRLIRSKLSSKLVLWLPEKYLDSNQLDHWKSIEPRYVKVFYNEFQKRYDCTLGEISQYQKPEFAFQEPSEFMFLAHKYNIKSDESWVDESEGSPEWETNDYTLAKAKIEMPERLLRLESKMERIESKMEQVVETVSSVERSLNNLVDLFSHPAKIDEFKDVV